MVEAVHGGAPARGRPGRGPGDRPDRLATLVSAIIMVVVVVALGGLLAVVARGRVTEEARSAAAPTPPPTSFLYPTVRDAAPISLNDPDGGTVTLASLRGKQVLVFFGYTHCPDVCPVTIGVVGNVLSTIGPDTRALLVTIDPERDTGSWLKEYVRFVPAGLTALTGTADEIRATADAWGVRYARVEGATPDSYTMSHTADVFLVDAAGRLRAHFPFGTQPEAMLATIRAVESDTPPGGNPPPDSSAASPATSAASAPPSAASASGRGQPTSVLRAEVVSTSVWAGSASPVILRLSDASGPIDDPAVRATVQLERSDGSPVGTVLSATAVKPPGVTRLSYVALIDVPSAGRWTLHVTAFRGGDALATDLPVDVLDPGATATLGQPAPPVRTPTVDDVEGDPRAVTTDPQPDLRLSSRSTADLLASHTPFVLVVDSVKFRVSPACGKAVGMARYLADRWPNVGFVHLEPYRYSLVSETPVLAGDIADPPLVDAATAWGIGSVPWAATSVPWVFVVDGNGNVRAKYEGLMGSDDVDVILALISGSSVQP